MDYRRLATALPLVLALLALCLTASATAAPGTGTLKLGLGAKGMSAAGIKAAGVKPAKGLGTITLPVSRLSVTGWAAIDLRGAIKLRTAKRSTTLRALKLRVRGRKGSISAVNGKRRYTFFAVAVAKGGMDLDPPSGRAALTGASLALTKSGARRLRRALKLRRLKAGRLGRVRGSGRLVTAPGTVAPGGKGAPGGGSTPASTACPVPAGTAPGATADPAPLPALAGSAQTTAAGIDWGFKQSFRNYVFHGGGSPPTPAIGAGDGATIVDGDADGADGNDADFFRFAGPGRYLRKQSAYDDQAVIEGSGVARFCYPSRFRMELATPTVVIDGADSRIVMSVSVNQNGGFGPARRVDFADLDLTGIRPTYSADGKTATWTGVPAALTADGATAFAGFYSAGQALDPITVSARIASVPDPYASQCPITLPPTPGGPGGDPAQVDHPPAALPALTNPAAVTGGSLSWGYKASFRSYVTGSPPAGTVSGLNGASDNGTVTTFPTARGGYEAGATAAEDRAVSHSGGTVMFCKAGHGFRVALSNPTVVIDGASSRVVLDVDSNYFQTEYPSQRVDYASLNLTGITPTYTNGGNTITWSNVPATVTADGETAFPQYAAGTALDPVTISVNK